MALTATCTTGCSCTSPRTAAPRPNQAARSLPDVDGWVRGTPLRVAEAHPELSFAGLAGAPLRSRKSTWAGAAERRALLARAGIVLADDLGPPAEQAGVDDVLDAAVMAWTAQRLG